MLIVSIGVILASLALLVAGWWGRAVDGKRQRQRKWMTIALIALCITFVVDFIVFWPRLRDHDWSRRKSTSWLLSDVESGKGLKQARAVNELVRRMAVKETPDEKIDPIIDRALAHQTDRSSDWDPIWATLIEAANDTKRLSKDKAKKYLENSVTASIEARPKVRRGQTMSVQLKWKIDRLSANSRLLTQFQGASLLLDSATIAPDFVPASPGPGTELGSTYTRAVVLSESVLAGLDDGPHRLATQVKVMMQQAKPFFTKPVTVNVPLSIPLQLVAKDAAVDEFKTNVNQRDAVRAAVSTVRVIHDAKPGVDVRVKATTLPASLAMKVVLKQGATEEEAGAIVIDAAQPPRWHSIFGRKPVTLRGTVDVCMRPDPAAADLQRKLNTYWGEEIVIPAVVIDAPYQPPFLHDPSLSATIARSVRVAVHRSPSTRPVGVLLGFVSSPVKLSCICSLALNGREVVINPEGLEVPPNANIRFRGLCDDIDPSGMATECDFILRPNPDWERLSADLTPPWDGKITIRGVKIATTKPSP